MTVIACTTCLIIGHDGEVWCDRPQGHEQGVHHAFDRVYEIWWRDSGAGDIDAAGNQTSGAPFDCPVCTQRVVFIDSFGHPMLCNVTTVVFGDEQRDWGTSGPHSCR